MFPALHPSLPLRPEKDRGKITFQIFLNKQVISGTARVPLTDLPLYLFYFWLLLPFVSQKEDKVTFLVI